MSFKITKKSLLFIVMFSVATSLIPKSSFAASCTYSLNGRAYSDSDGTTVNLTGFMEIASPFVDNNYIEWMLSSNSNALELAYDILDSNIRLESDEEFSTGSGKINLRFLKTYNGTWDNYSEWQCGNIQTSWVEGDVYFENKTLQNLNDYDFLPSYMFLQNGMVFNQYSFIDLNLTQYDTNQNTPVPEPSALFLICSGLFVFNWRSLCSFNGFISRSA